MTGWRPPTASRVFRSGLAAYLDRARREVSPDAFELLVLTYLVADKRGRIPTSVVADMNDLLDSGEVEVGYTTMADGAVRVWCREIVR